MQIQQKQITIGLLVLVLLLAFALRFYQLDAQSLWNDEGTSVALAQRDLATIARDAAHDIHPPLYYWLLSGWMRLFGSSEPAVRSLSAALGVVLVALTCVLGRMLAGRWAGLTAALLAALNPFQVYYSQEVRMYMLLAVLTAGVALALVRIVAHEPVTPTKAPALAGLVLLEAAGLYTHYSFAFVVLSLNLTYALWLALTWRQPRAAKRALIWMLSQMAVILLYLPWLPIAIGQVVAWPTRGQATALLPALATTWRWLVFGPAVETAQVAVPLLVAALLTLFGALSLAAGWLGLPTPRDRWSAGLLVLWLGLPVLLMFILGLYREAYLKFLLTTSPAVILLLSCGLLGPVTRLKSRTSRFAFYALRLAQLLAALLLVIASILALHNTYANPAYARDDYRGIAAYIEAVGRPGDAVLLNAPGQQEVFAYYYGGNLPVHPLPEARPLDPAATEAALQALIQPGARVFAVLWATDESDPERFVESWLDDRTYKALDSWYGNVRLVTYAVPEQTPTTPDQTLDIPLIDPATGERIWLLGYSQLGDRLAAGDIAQITLFWQAQQTPRRRYKVFLHALDGADQIVGQRDAEPGGGVRLTTLWTPGEVVVDNHGLPIHPATPPGEYRVEVGLYAAETGQRLTAPDGSDRVWLEPLVVERPTVPAQAISLGMQVPAGEELGELALLGYDAHKLGFAGQPDVSPRAGDRLQVSLYWQALTQPTRDWQLAIQLLDPEGGKQGEIVTEPVVGYPTSVWQAGDVCRGQFNLPLPGNAPPGRYRLRIQLVGPDGTSPGLYLSEPIVVVP